MMMVPLRLLSIGSLLVACTALVPALATASTSSEPTERQSSAAAATAITNGQARQVAMTATKTESPSPTSTSTMAPHQQQPLAIALNASTTTTDPSGPANTSSPSEIGITSSDGIEQLPRAEFIGPDNITDHTQVHVNETGSGGEDQIATEVNSADWLVVKALRLDHNNKAQEPPTTMTSTERASVNNNSDGSASSTTTTTTAMPLSTRASSSIAADSQRQLAAVVPASTLPPPINKDAAVNLNEPLSSAGKIFLAPLRRPSPLRPTVDNIDGVAERCPAQCYCDSNGSYVTCVGERPLDLSLPVGVPDSVTRLEVRGFRLGMLRSRQLKRFSKVRQLALLRNGITSLDIAAFKSMPGLQRLDLSENQIRRISSLTFKGIEKSLRYLDLSSNNLTTISDTDPSPFIKLDQLEQLNLADNRLMSLSISTFLGLSRLQYLNLDQNRLRTIQVGTFIHLPLLGHLVLSNNPFTADNTTTMVRVDSISKKLKYIDLSNVGLSSVPSGIDPYVRDLRLARNYIGNISCGDLDGYPYLYFLVLDDNEIEYIEDDAFGRLEFLRRLWLNGNRLKTVPDNLPPSLQELYLEENEIQTVDGQSLRGLTRLRRLFLRGNPIHSISQDAFSDLVSLAVLDMHPCPSSHCVPEEDQQDEDPSGRATAAGSGVSTEPSFYQRLFQGNLIKALLNASYESILANYHHTDQPSSTPSLLNVH